MKHKVIWGLPIGAISVAMTIAGGLTSLQTASVVTGLPFSIILLLMTLSIMRALRREHTKHFQMSYIDDDKDYSIPLEQRDHNKSNEKNKVRNRTMKKNNNMNLYFNLLPLIGLIISIFLFILYFVIYHVDDNWLL